MGSRGGFWLYDDNVSDLCDRDRGIARVGTDVYFIGTGSLLLSEYSKSVVDRRASGIMHSTTPSTRLRSDLGRSGLDHLGMRKRYQYVEKASNIVSEYYYWHWLGKFGQRGPLVIAEKN